VRFRIRYERAALDELLRIRVGDRARIVDEVRRHLGQEPATPTSRKKEIKGLAPPWDHVPPVWQLRVDDYRVFYDVDPEGTVTIRAVRRKGGRTTKEIL